jgi:hypothetical protein
MKGSKMKTKIILGLTFVVAILISCNGRSNKVSVIQNKRPETQSNSQLANTSDSNLQGTKTKNTGLMQEIVNSYLVLKNALAEDNSTDVSKAGFALLTAFKNFNRTTLIADQKKIFEEVAADAMENAEHIGMSGGNITHQREHFELLSKDIYDLIKSFGTGQTLYKEFCSMYNNGKGAFWISETKEIKNPYMGKSMPNCGTIEEELK